MNIFHSFIVTIVISFSSLLSFVGLGHTHVATVPVVTPTATATEQVAEETPATTTRQTTAPSRAHVPTAVLSVTVQGSDATSTADVPAPVIPATASGTSPIVIQVNIPAPAPVQTPAPTNTGSNITNQPTQTVPMETTYTITAPINAPQATLDLLGNNVKTLAEMRDFVVSLNPQLNFKKKMQNADADTLTDYLSSNGYTIEVNEEK